MISPVLKSIISFNIRKIVRLRQFYLNFLLVAVIIFLMMHLFRQKEATASPQLMEAMISLIATNVFMFLNILLTLQIAMQIFLHEKQNKIMTMLFCTPAGIMQVIFGKTIAAAGVVYASSLLCLAVGSLLSGFNIWAHMGIYHYLSVFLIVPLITTAITFICGAVMLSQNDPRTVTIPMAALMFGIMYPVKQMQNLIISQGYRPVFLISCAMLAVLVIIAAALKKVICDKTKVLETCN